MDAVSDGKQDIIFDENKNKHIFSKGLMTDLKFDKVLISYMLVYLPRAENMLIIVSYYCPPTYHAQVMIPMSYFVNMYIYIYDYLTRHDF